MATPEIDQYLFFKHAYAAAEARLGTNSLLDATCKTITLTRSEVEEALRAQDVEDIQAAIAKQVNDGILVQKKGNFRATEYGNVIYYALLCKQGDDEDEEGGANKPQQ